MFLTFIAPIQGLFILISLMVMADTTFAMYASVKLKGWRSLASDSLFNLPVKTIAYLGSILLAYLASVYITEGMLFGVNLFLPKFMCAFWTFIELLSIEETRIKLEKKPFLEILKNLIKWLKHFKKDLSGLTDFTDKTTK